MRPQKPRTTRAVVKLELPLKRDEAFQIEVEEFLKGLRIEQHLIRLRKDRQLTQTQLADLLSVTQPFIAKMESGQLTNIELRTLARTVLALNGKLSIKIESNSAARSGSRAAKAHG